MSKSLARQRRLPRFVQFGFFLFIEDVERRQAMVTASQLILRNYYTPETWSDKMMALLNDL